MRNRTQVILALLLPVQYIALLILRQFPEFVEEYYSQGLYPYIAKLSRFVFGWIPFSIGDIFYALLIVVLVRWIYKKSKRLISSPVQFMVGVLSSLSVIYLLFNLLWGLNYYRVPLHQTLELERDYTTEELINTTQRLIEKSNELHRQLGYSDSTKIDLPYTQQEIFNKSSNGYVHLSKEYPNLHVSPKSIKKSTWSLGLTYMGYSGYFNPLTGEAQVNQLIKTYKFPVVSCHEQA
ncbi:MAG: DUF3810 domain-containing protein, partial [Bacteroidia bacterium]|nr:DUF3810 domain-containing protein [Bacteroidia bacterium]